MDAVKLEIALAPTNAAKPLSVSLAFDGQIIESDWLCDQDRTFVLELPETPGHHALTMEISGKTSDHTTIDDAGNILSDSQIQIQRLNIDTVDIMPIFVNSAVYRHDFNGTGELIDDQCFGLIGCNGIITLDFETPIYLWLLDNL